MSSLAARGALVLAFGCSLSVAERPSKGVATTPFVDITDQVGIQHAYLYPPSVASRSRNFGGGAVAEDLDGDFAIDLYVSNGVGPKSLFWNNGDGTFTEGAVTSGAGFPEDWTAGVAAADVDNDGDQDLMLVNMGPDRLLINEGDRVFREATWTTGLELATAGHGASFGDVNGDGWLDVFVGRAPLADTETRKSPTSGEVTYPYAIEPSNLFLSNQNGTWRDASAVIVPGGLPPGNSFAGGLIDLDADGDIDLFLVQDSQERKTNSLFANVGVTAVGDVRFKDVSAGCGCIEPGASMGLAVLDLDNNALPDFFITNLISSAPNREVLLMNRGGMQFQDFAEPLGATAMDAFAPTDVRSSSWAAMSLDVEDDGFEDLYVVYSPLTYLPGERFGSSGRRPELVRDQPNALIRAQRSGLYVVATDSGLEDKAMSHAAVTADFDGDGCEDVFVVNIDSPSRLYHNACEHRGHFVDLQLVGTTANRDAIGARVRVEAGGKTYTRQVLGCSVGTSSCMPKRVHIGLGAATTVDSVRIGWPGGPASGHTGIVIDELNVIEQPPVPDMRPGTSP